MTRWPWQRWLARWDALDHVQRAHGFAIMLCGALFLFHFAWYSHWYIEDAAISFAYSRSLAAGDGFAPWPGGEQVEGFSNPTWTIALGLLDLIGVSPWVGAKLLGAVLGLAGLPLAYRWTQEALGERRDMVPLATPLLLALSPQYVTWCASGLENSVMVLCMAGGGAFILREMRDETAFPWSGVWWGVLAISRPEAPLYVAVAGLVGGFTILGNRGLKSSLWWAWRWLLFASAPFLVWHLFAYVWFAWEAPNTYFAKLHDGGRFRPWEWSGGRARGWGYLRSYAFTMGHGFLLWLYLLAQTGFGRVRRWFGVGLSLVTLVVILPGIVWLWSVWGEAPLDGLVPALGDKGELPLWPFAKDPDWWVTGRVWFMVIMAVIPPLFGIGRKLQGARVLGYWLCTAVLFFAVYAGGDWMDGYRWLSLCCVPLTVLLIEALTTASRRLPSAWSGVLRSAPAGVVLITIAVLQVVSTVGLISRPETTPYSVYRRVLYAQTHMQRLDMDHATIMDVDMGAHMWFSDMDIVDIAGLIDIPMGHHKWEKPFVAEYVFDETQPDFAHVHGGWASKLGVGRHKRWRQDYVEVPHFPVSSRKQHIGSHVRRDLFMRPDSEVDDGRRVDFAGGLSLRSWHTPAPVVPSGGELALEVAFSARRAVKAPRVLAVLSGQGRLVVHELPPAYDWLAPIRWEQDEVAVGRHALKLPDDLPQGSYDLAFVVLDVGGRGIRAATKLPEGAINSQPVYARGEVRWPGVVTVMADDAVREHAMQRWQSRPGSASCEQVHTLWRETRRHLPRGDRFARELWRDARRPVLDCYLDRVEDGGQSTATRVASGVAARQLERLDHRVQNVTRRYARELALRASELEAQGDLDGAYAHLRDSLLLDPSHAWRRRHAEKIRDQRLEITRELHGLQRLFGQDLLE